MKKALLLFILLFPFILSAQIYNYSLGKFALLQKNGNAISLLPYSPFSLKPIVDSIQYKDGSVQTSAFSGYKQTKTRVGSDSIYFDKPVTVYTTDTIKASITLSPRHINAVSGYTAIQRVIGDGSHTISFSGVNGSDVFDPTLNQVSLIVWLYDGIEWWYSIKVK